MFTLTTGIKQRMKLTAPLHGAKWLRTVRSLRKSPSFANACKGQAPVHIHDGNELRSDKCLSTNVCDAEITDVLDFF